MEILGGKPDNPGKGKGQRRLGVCQYQGGEGENPKYKYKVLPEPAALKMISQGKAVPATSQEECDSLTDAIVKE